eukprot:jgi/Chlat1/4418/Chrsp29S04619
MLWRAKQISVRWSSLTSTSVMRHARSRRKLQGNSQATDDRIVAAQAQVLDSGDLVCLMARVLCPRDRARAGCVNKLWRDACWEIEDEYYRLTRSHAELKAHVRVCRAQLTILRFNEREGTEISYLAFCMAQHDGCNLLVPQRHTWAHKDCRVMFCYAPDGRHAFAPATLEKLSSLANRIVVNVFALRVADGELLHLATQCCKSAVQEYGDGMALSITLCAVCDNGNPQFRLGTYDIVFEQVQTPDNVRGYFFFKVCVLAR